jgi:hypothetical protein
MLGCTWGIWNLSQQTGYCGISLLRHILIENQLYA